MAVAHLETPDALVDSAPDGQRRTQAKVLTVFFGILLPLAALALKGMCAEGLFDPAPTLAHVALIALVPAFHTLALLKPPATLRRYHVDVLGAMTVGVASVYTLVFLPLMPIALIAILAGIGILPFAPLGALLSGVFTLRWIYRKAPFVAEVDATLPSPPPFRLDPSKHPRWRRPRPWFQRGRLRVAGGVLMGILSLAALEAPLWSTNYGLELASSPDPERSHDGIVWLRRWGSTSALLDAGKDWGRRRTTLPYLRGASPVTPAEARTIYYRVTGQQAEQSEEFQDDHERRWRNDAALGGRTIGAINPDLALVTSRQDGSIDAEAALGYVEWTLVFKNRHEFQQAEARARLHLPPGGVVSRATLWIDGEPREAAFGKAGQVREAYRRVVSRRRDPLLVTSSGPDQVQLQCFPIEPGGEMKILVGITFPLDLVNTTRAAFPLPRLEAKNFQIVTGQPIWLEAKSQLGTKEHLSKSGKNDQQILRFTQEGRWWEAEPGTVSTSREGSSPSWTPLLDEPDQTEDTAVVRDIVPEKPTPPARLAIVVDTSAGMDSGIEALAAAVGKLPGTIPTRLALPTDRNFVWSRSDASLATAQLQDDLDAIDPQGGVDNAPALVAAGSWAAQANNGMVLWVHGPEPVPLGSPDAVLQTLERANVRLLHAQTRPGEHVLLGALGSPLNLTVLPRFADLQTDLVRQFERWSGERPTWTFSHRRVTTLDETARGHRTSDHLLRLWAYERIESLRHDQPARAAELAVKRRLVTPVSGAVVLETAQQYEEAGLDPGEGVEGSPSVPEPETWALLILCAVVLAWQLRRRQLGYQAA